MTCEHCVRAVSDELTALAAVRSVRVDLVDGAPSRVTVDATEVLDEQAVRAAVDEAGYELVGVAEAS
jgi:copper chaperone CopZ